MAHKCGLSESTIRNLETGRHKPCAQTLQAIAAVLPRPGRDDAPSEPSPSTMEPSVSPWPSLWLGADDALRMNACLRRALAGEGGFLPLPWLLSDPACATAFVHYRNRHDPLARRKLWRDVAQVVRQFVGGRAMDVLALGCADATDELSLLDWLLTDGLRRLRVLLVEQSAGLLGVALRQAISQLGDSQMLSIAGLQAALSELPQHRLWTGEHPKLFTLLAPQFGLLDGEMWLLRQALWHARPRDLFLLGFDVAGVAASDRRLLLGHEPMLMDVRQAEPLLVRFIETVFRGHLGRHTDLQLSTSIDFASCAIPSSYAVELRAELVNPRSHPKRFSVWRSKRYEPRALAQSMQQQDWQLVAEWQEHHQTPAMGLQLYQRVAGPELCASEERPRWGSFQEPASHTADGPTRQDVDTRPPVCADAISVPGRRRGVTLCRAIEQGRCQAVLGRPRGAVHSVGDRVAKLARLLLQR